MEKEQARWITENEAFLRGSFDDFVDREGLEINDKPKPSEEPTASWVSIIRPLISGVLLQDAIKEP
jgi:hypothetical protein